MAASPTLPRRIDRRALLGKPKLRSKAHRDWVRSHMCCMPGCEDMPIEVAQVNTAVTRGIGMKSSDALTISLCRVHHRESHQGGESFQAKYRLCASELAEAFYRSSPHRRLLDDPFKKDG